MEESLVAAAGILGAAMVLTMVVYMFGRLKLEQQKTLQKLLDKDEETRADWSRILGHGQRAEADFRRGSMLVVVGAALTVLFFFMGGIGWIFGFVPILLGLVYLFFWKRNADRP